MRNYLAFFLRMLMILPLSTQDKATANGMVTAFDSWMPDSGAAPRAKAVLW